MKFGPNRISRFRAALAARAVGTLGLAVCAAAASAQGYLLGDLTVSTSIYTGTASTAPVGSSLPGGGKSVSNGANFLTVWNNATPDASFGITSPIIFQQLTKTGTLQSTTNITQLAAQTLGLNLTTSFSSKSELAINFGVGNNSISFMDYNASANTLDVSNSNTPGIIEPGNYTANSTYRVAATLTANGVLDATTTNAYNGNNPRGTILVSNVNGTGNSEYLSVGNAGNGNGSAATTAATGVQIITPGQNATPSTPGTTQAGQFNVTQVGLPADKLAKDNNFRGETIFDNTLYVTKGSGSNGIDTVYQVGTQGTLPTGSGNTISVLPGFSTAPAKTTTGAALFHPFGIWFANSTTLYVADEGDQSITDTAATNVNAGLEKWSLVNGTWKEDYDLTAGLNLDIPYATNAPGYIAGINSGKDGTDLPYDAETDGLRNLDGQINANGTVTLYAVTSTVSGLGDTGADPNELVAITDTLGDTSLSQAAGESFTVLEAATPGEVIRGVAVNPTPEPGAFALLAAGSLVGIGFRRRRSAGRSNA